MSRELWSLGVVFVAAGGAAWAFARMTRGVTVFAVGGDDELQLLAAARSSEWRWPSDMHLFGKGKARMKDVGVLGLAVLQRVLRDRRTAHPLVVLAGLATAASSVMVFLVAQAYWSTEIGLLLFALFLTSVWPHQIALNGGYQGLSQLFLLVSAYALQQAGGAPSAGRTLWSIAAGAAAALMMSSSASGRKFLLLFAGAFLVSQGRYLAPLGVASQGWQSLRSGAGPVLLGLAAAAAIGAILGRPLIQRFYDPVITFLYHGRGPRWARSAIGGQAHGLPLHHYLARRQRVLRAYDRTAVGIGLYLLVALLLSRSAEFYLAQLLIAAGAAAVVLLFTYPDVLGNIKGYLDYWRIPNRHCHFRLYVDWFARRGQPIREDMRGAGLRWVVRFFGRVAPFHTVYAALTLGLLGVTWAVRGIPPGLALKTAGIIALGLSPIIFGEITRSPQLGRSYFPGFLGLLLIIGFATFHLQQTLVPAAHRAFWTIAAAGVLLSAAWNLWVFFDDVWPARMTAAWLHRHLRALGAHAFYTYDSPYNDALVRAMTAAAPEAYQIHYIRSLDEVPDGYIVVPGTSAKAVHMESHQYAIQRGDFAEDPTLNHLLDSREITRYAVTWLRTYGTSRFWVQDSEMTSYRDLILNDISDADRWRGRAWLLHAPIRARTQAKTVQGPGGPSAPTA